MVIMVIGGGASGLMAASAAKRQSPDTRVIVIERLDRVGKKILATGNGRCNFSNINTSPANYYGNDPSFVNNALKEFTVDDTVNFFNSIGVFPREEQEGKLYPYSLQASAVLDALRMHCEGLGIEFITQKKVVEISVKKGALRAIFENGERMRADRIILAAGGCADPALGSDGSGFEILKKLGHTITPLSPALVQVKTETAAIKGLSGIKIEGLATLIQKDTVVSSEYGEVLFTDYGLSGPPIFQLSAKMPFKKNMVISLDFMHEYAQNHLYDILEGRKNALGEQTMETFFVGLLNKRLGNLVARRAGIEKLSFPVNKLDKDLLWNMARIIKDYRIEVTGLNGFKNAQVTAGGASTREFSPYTMQSKITEGLYCCGEILDIHGDCGGFNLQWAWSSGHLAGINAVKTDNK